MDCILFIFSSPNLDLDSSRLKMTQCANQGVHSNTSIRLTPVIFLLFHSFLSRTLVILADNDTNVF